MLVKARAKTTISVLNAYFIFYMFVVLGIFYLEFLSYYGESASKTAIVGSVLNGMYLSMGEYTYMHAHT